MKTRIMSFVLLVLGTCFISYSEIKAQSTNTPQHIDAISGINRVVPFQANYASVSIQPLHGVAAITHVGTNYQLNYLSQAGFVGTDTLKVFRITQSAVFQSVTYIIHVSASHIYAKADYTTTLQNTPKTITVTANDSTTSLGDIYLSEVVVTNGGVATIVNNKVLFTPTTGFTGEAYLRYTACDDNGACAVANIGIYVTPTTLPSTDTIAVFAPKGRGTIILVPTGFALSVAPNYGTLAAINSAAYRYTPSSSFAGIEYVKFTHIGAPASSYVAKIEVIGTGYVNKYAKPDFAYTPIGTSIKLKVLKNDVGRLKVNQVTGSNGGTVILHPNDSITFIPNPGFEGVASYAYHVIPKPGTTVIGPAINEWATVKIMVSNQAPEVNNYTFNTVSGAPLVLSYNATVPNYNFDILVPPTQGTVTYYAGQQTLSIGGQTISGTNMIIYTPNEVTPIPDVFVLNYNINGTSSAITIHVNQVNNANQIQCFEDCVWPGDANYDGEVNIRDIMPLGLNTGNTGAERPAATATWIPQTAENWTNSNSQFINAKHADMNGDGIASDIDTAFIRQNYGLSHSILNPVLGFPTDYEVAFEVVNQTIAPGDLVTVLVNLGTENTPVLNNYGISFSADYNTALIVDTTVHANFVNQGWLTAGAPALQMNIRPNTGRLDAGAVRTDATGIGGYGPIGTLSFIVIDDIDGFQTGQNAATQIKVTQITATDANGQSFTLPDAIINIPITIPQKDEPSRAELLIYPNPTAQFVHVHLNGTDELQQIRITNINGTKVWQADNLQGKQQQIAVDQWPNGIYVVETITRDQKHITQKVVVQH